MKIRLSDFGYVYDCRNLQNPPECRCLLSENNDGRVLYGICWEEAREISQIRVNLDNAYPAFCDSVLLEYFSPQTAPFCNAKLWTWEQGTWAAYPKYPLFKTPNELIYPECSVMTKKIRLRMQAHCSGQSLDMKIEVIGKERYQRNSIFVKRGLWGVQSVEGEYNIYNGVIRSIAKNGGADLLDVLFTEQKQTEHSRINPDRTVVSVPAGESCVSFLPADLADNDYIAIPHWGILIYCDEAKLPNGIFHKAPYRGKTIRERVRLLPQRCLEDTERDIGLKPVIVMPQTEDFEFIEPKTKLNIPDKRLKKQWDIGLSHLMSFCSQETDGSWDIRIGPYPMIGMESAPIIMMLDLYGMHDIAEYGLKKLLQNCSVRRPEGMYQSSEGCLCMPYGLKESDCWLGFDPGCILLGLAEHYLFTGDTGWFASVADKMLACCDWILREIKDHWADGAWDCGLLPPHIGGDVNDWYSYYFSNGIHYMALRKCMDLFISMGGNYAQRALNWTPQIQQFRDSMRKAFKRSISLSPVKPRKNGTFDITAPPFPYLRGLMSDIMPYSPQNALRNAWFDIDLSALKLLEAGVFTPEDPEYDRILDFYEDNLLLDGFLLPKKWDAVCKDTVTNARDATGMTTNYDAEQDWFAWGGTGWQNGYNPLFQIYLHNGEKNALLRSMYNCYALEADPETHWFRECAASLHYPPKTFEEAMFLYRLRFMLVQEKDGSLHLAQCVPDLWFNEGFGIDDMPTYYGNISYKVSLVDKGNGVFRFQGTLEKRESSPKEIILYIKYRQVKLDCSRSQWDICTNASQEPR